MDFYLVFVGFENKVFMTGASQALHQYPDWGLKKTHHVLQYRHSLNGPFNEPHE
jgi:hypothetical protein